MDNHTINVNPNTNAAGKGHGFGNGRFARNIFDKTIEIQSTRLATQAQLTPSNCRESCPRTSPRKDKRRANIGRSCCSVRDKNIHKKPASETETGFLRNARLEGVEPPTF